MPSRTLTPDPPTAPGQHTPPEPPASSGPRLRITVPAGWPPYDCETHGAACPVAREAATTNPHVSQVPAAAPAGRWAGPEPPPAPGQAPDP